MYEDLFKQIADASGKNSLTFFVGAGVSRLSGAPSWLQLIEDINKKLGEPDKKEYSSEDFLRIPQMYYYSIEKRDDEYFTYLETLIDCSDLQPNLVHKMLFDFKPRSIITTNFDDLLEKSSVQFCQSFKTVACDAEVPQINGNRFILKIHGDMEHRNIVFKEEDYLSYSENFKLIETMLKSIFSTDTVVFIGYGLNDYNIKLILNWSKELLKDDFSRPIFIYTDDRHLSENELRYHESRGLSVIEHYKCDNFIEDDSANKYLNRYTYILKMISCQSELTSNSKEKYELFNALYSTLLPLDKMFALKPRDINYTVSSFAIVEDVGVILPKPKCNLFFEYYMEIDNMSSEQKEKLPKEDIVKYNVITSVFSKGLIRQYKCGNRNNPIKGVESRFADELCVSFNYSQMFEYTNKTYYNPSDDYFKAYYYAKLSRFREAFEIFTSVAVSAFKNEDYLLYYIAQTNRENIFHIMKQRSIFVENNGLDNLEMLSFQLDFEEIIFYSLPVEFQNKYGCFKNLCSANFLYQNLYEAFADGQNLQKILETNTMEFGLTSTDKVGCRVYNILHFLLGNGLYLDEYDEFKKTIQNLMTLLIYKYSVQNRQSSHNSLFPHNEQLIKFDNIDFYCFIEYFSSGDLKYLFHKYEIKKLEFVNSNVIEQNILNLINSYEKVKLLSKSIIEIEPYEEKIHNCLILMRYMDISHGTVEEVCQFVLEHEFTKIYINEKIMFIDHQIAKGVRSQKIDEIVENQLLKYCKIHLSKLESGEEFHMLSTSGIFYYNLADYINPEFNNPNKKLSELVEQMITADTKVLANIFEHFYPLLTAETQNNIIQKTKQILNDQFDFKYFSLLIQKEIPIEQNDLASLTKYLDELVSNNKDKEPPGVAIYPEHNRFSDLVSVGYWCLLKIIPRQLFQKYVGFDKQFDFYYLYEDFNYENFDIKWLFNLYPTTYKEIAKSKVVKSNIRPIIINAIQGHNYSKNDEKILYDILLKYFID